MADKKPHMNLVVIGHVDHGKSTTVGRLLFDSGSLPEQELRKLKEEAERLGKATFEFAFAMDSLKEERERGVTIDVAHKEINTKNHYFTVIDAPGHKDFVKNMITGTSQADAAVLVVSAKDGPQEQTREHAFLARTLGVGQMIIAFNKMDAVEYKQDAFDKAKEELVNKILKPIGYKVDEMKFIPISAYKGDNVVKKSENMSWYNGPTLIDALDELKQPEKPTDKPLRLPIQDVYNIKGVGMVPVGRVETGVLKVGEKVSIMPAGVIGEVKSIEMHHQQQQTAEPGDNIGFNLKGVDKKNITRGSVLGPANEPATLADEFTAQVIVLNHPTAITVGYQPVLHCHTTQVACTVVAIEKKMDPKTGQVVAENPEFIKTGDAAVVRFKPTRPLVIESAKEYSPLGRFAIRDMGTTVAAGMVLSVKKKA